MFSDCDVQMHTRAMGRFVVVLHCNSVERAYRGKGGGGEGHKRSIFMFVIGEGEGEGLRRRWAQAFIKSVHFR